MSAILERASVGDLADLRQAYLASQAAPFDGMWETFATMSPHRELRFGGKRVGYFCVNDEGRLLQFFVVAPYEHVAAELFTAAVARDEVKGAMVSTADPLFLGLCLDLQKEVGVHTYLYRDHDRREVALTDAAGASFNVVPAGELTLYFEDMQVGDKREIAGYTFTREEIIEFGRRFDPQPFHIDEEAAERSPYGGLIASGWHTVSACMQILVTSLLGPESGSLGSPGADEIRWLKPVRPGDTLSVLTEVIEKRPSRSKPDRGLVKLRWTARNQNSEDVMTMIGLGIFRKRPSHD